MALAAGARCGPYQITAKIGAGGMGEVYHARDTKLDRDVALKILPEAFASDPERLARFEREARILAALNHPHIAHIHGLEESGDVRALVLEFVDGPTLADRIAQGPVPIDEALTIAGQIADALEAAHEQGIIHRDLKPANIKLRTDGTVKVLDFGLAKALDPASTGTVGVSASPTITSPAPMTALGVVLGTVSYMSPEQARGLALDKRTDIWAFGCVLFEMIAGRMAFPGATTSDAIAAVLERSPDWTALPPATPPGVRHTLARCLEKNPKQRWRDIGDVRIQLGDAEKWRPQTDRPSAKTSRAGERIAWALLVGLAAAVAVLVTPLVRKPPPPAEIRFNLLYPRGMTADFAQLAISADGQQIVVSPSFGTQGPSPLWLRPLASTTGRLLTGTESAGFPFWSPDGRSIGFFADQKLKRLDLNTQAIQDLAEAPNARGGAWQADGTIIFAPNASGPLFRVPATGGQATAATRLEAGQNDHRAPFILPDGEHFLYYARGNPQVRGVHVARLDGTEAKRLMDADGAAVYTPSGHLLFAWQQELLAQSFDVTRLALDGEPFRVADSVAVNPGLSLASLSASAAGPIAYGLEGIRRTQFAWFDRSGRRLETVGPPDQRSMANPSLSPDGKRIAFSRLVGRNWDIWLSDMQGAVSNVSSAPSLDFNPVWSYDGRQVFYQSNNANIYSRSVIDGTPPQALLSERTMVYPSAVSPDGSVLLYTRATGPSTDLWYMALTGDATPHPFVQTASSERDGQFSPDGKWVAYQSNELGHDEIYLQPFPGPGARMQVSEGGGQQVRWARNGSELFYIARDHRLTSVRVTSGASGKLVLGTPVPLFPTEFDNSLLTRQQYVVSPDGQRFLMNAATDAIDPPSITLILNWKGRP
jgi:serine/threonine protein kinase/Tol biopolymer transport system component